jgi:hypothetical protein
MQSKVNIVNMNYYKLLFRMKFQDIKNDEENYTKQKT